MIHNLIPFNVKRSACFFIFALCARVRHRSGPKKRNVISSVPTYRLSHRNIHRLDQRKLEQERCARAFVVLCEPTVFVSRFFCLFFHVYVVCCFDRLVFRFMLFLPSSQKNKTRESHIKKNVCRPNFEFRRGTTHISAND